MASPSIQSFLSDFRTFFSLVLLSVYIELLDLCPGTLKTPHQILSGLHLDTEVVDQLCRANDQVALGQHLEGVIVSNAFRNVSKATEMPGNQNTVPDVSSG
jgi:hypothetical protein